MKKFIAYFVKLFIIIWNFFFGKKKVEKIVEEKISTPEIKYSNKPSISSHNNRKTHEGRRVQYINIGDGRTRAIYHSAK